MAKDTGIYSFAKDAGIWQKYAVHLRIKLTCPRPRR